MTPILSDARETEAPTRDLCLLARLLSEGKDWQAVSQGHRVRKFNGRERETEPTRGLEMLGTRFN